MEEKKTLDPSNSEDTPEVDVEEPETDDGWDDEETITLSKKEYDEILQKNKKLYDKVKWGYKKAKNVKTNYISKDELRAELEAIDTEKKVEQELIDKDPDVKEILPEIRKIVKEKGLSVIEAHQLVKGKMYDDEWYRNQILWDRSKSYWEIKRVDSNTTFKKVFWDAPAFLKK